MEKISIVSDDLRPFIGRPDCGFRGSMVSSGDEATSMLQIRSKELICTDCSVTVIPIAFRLIGLAKIIVQRALSSRMKKAIQKGKKER